MASPTTDEFRAAMSAVPTPVTVIGAIGPDGPAGATANAVASLSLDPPLMLACLERGSRTLATVRAAGRFSVNVLGDGDEGLARAFASKAAPPEKWAGVEWIEVNGTPRIVRSPVWIACELHDLVEGGDHVILTGSVLTLARVDGHAPLLFHHGRYRPLAAG